MGLCSSPLFLNFERGSTTLGKGSLAAYLYVPEGAFDLGGVYTEIDLKLDRNYPMYDEEYERRLSETADALEPLAKTLEMCIRDRRGAAFLRPAPKRSP